MNTNAKDIKTLQEQRVQDVITTKELYERIIALEVKFDTMWSENKKVRIQFRKYVQYLMLAILLDIFFSLLFIWMNL